MKQSRKDFIKKAHESACIEWKTNIEKEFPKLFKDDDLVVGQWYKSIPTRSLMVFNNGKEAYGFFNEKYGTNWAFGIGSFKPLATDKEVEQALVKEAKKRGFKDGVNYKTASKMVVKKLVFNKLQFNQDSNGGFLTDGFGGSIFEYGKWATIIETITKEQAEKAKEVLAQYNKQ